MTEETPGFEEKPDVPSGATSDDAAEAAESPEKEDKAAPAGDAAKTVGLTAELDQVRTALAERTGDLQRLQAEYQNYRRRVERDRVAVKEIATATLLTELLPVLDDIGRARDHGELVGGFKSVAESLETAAAKMGLQQFGQGGRALRPDDPRGADAQLRAGCHRDHNASRCFSRGIASASGPSAPPGSRWPSPSRARPRRPPRTRRRRTRRAVARTRADAHQTRTVRGSRPGAVPGSAPDGHFLLLSVIA
ncbi:protein grpE [Streptomyces clavuligerus]|nr:protein grpE [Streptomyces clavuligerus]